MRITISHWFVAILNDVQFRMSSIDYQVLDKGTSEEGVLEEAEFYNVTGLIKILKERIRIRDQVNNGDSRDGHKHVYRVLAFCRFDCVINKSV